MYVIVYGTVHRDIQYPFDQLQYGVCTVLGKQCEIQIQKEKGNEAVYHQRELIK